MGDHTTFTALVLALGASALTLGCAGETDDEVRVTVDDGSVETRIYGGERDDDDAAMDGVVALRVGLGATFELCTGALIAPNVVLTARHCLTRNSTTRLSCDEHGRAGEASHVEGDEDPGTIGVYVGASPDFGTWPLALGKAIVAPSGPLLCDSDIGILVLDRALQDVTPLPVRLDAPAREGERVRPVGYGKNDADAPIGTRFRRRNVPVLARGKKVSKSRTPLGTHELELGKGSCQGDSGGPAIAEETGAIVGVASRGGECNDPGGHVFTTTAGFDAMFAEAFRLAGGAPRFEAGAAHPLVTSPADEADVLPEEAAAPDGGCALAPRRVRGGDGAGALVAVGLVLAVARCRRTSRRVTRA